jgi:hypothetical protein
MAVVSSVVASLAAVLLCSASVGAQTGSIRGRVVDSSSRQALPHVSVVVEGTPRAVKPMLSFSAFARR